MVCNISVLTYSQEQFMMKTKPQKKQELDTKIKSENEY